MNEDEGYFTFCVAAIIEKQDNEILLLKRSPGNHPENIWDVVGGRVEQFENPFDGLNREIIEETGIRDFEIIKAIDVFHWFQEDSSFDMIGITFWCKTKTMEVILSNEHVEYKWLNPEKALEISTHHIVTGNLEKFIIEKKRIGLY